MFRPPCYGSIIEVDDSTKLKHMEKKITPPDNSSDQQNSNGGTTGFNERYQKAQDNRSRQLNPKQQGGKKKK
jgi:hypothetical protein